MQEEIEMVQDEHRHIKSDEISGLRLREYFHQEALPLKIHEVVKKISTISNNADADNYHQALFELREYLEDLHSSCSPSFIKSPEKSKKEDLFTKGKVSELRKTLKSAYFQEIRQGVKTITDAEDFITSHPEVTPVEMLEILFEETQDGLVPQTDITNEQAFYTLAAGLTYLVDHKIMLSTKQKYGNDAVRVARELYGIELIKPEVSRVSYGDDIGVYLTISKEDLMQKTENTNPGGFYLSESALNNQLIALLIDEKGVTQAEWLRHERDHMFFSKYRTIKDLFIAKPDSQEVRRRLNQDPLAAELILNSHDYKTLKKDMSREISAYTLDWQTRYASLSVHLEKHLPVSSKKNKSKTRSGFKPGVPKKDFFSPSHLLRESVMKAAYPIIRQELFIKFYHAMDMCQQAVTHGVSPREVSTALAILGVDKVDHLKALDPYLSTQHYDTHISVDAIHVKHQTPLPYLFSYIRRYDHRFQNCAGDLFTLFPDLKNRLSRLWKKQGITKRQEEKRKAEEKYPFSPEELSKRYYSEDRTPEDLDTSSFKTILTSTGRILFPQLTEAFFQDAYSADTPFHPIFRDDSMSELNIYYSSFIAQMIKQVSTEGEEWLDKSCEQLLTIREKSGQEHLIMGIGAFWETQYIPLVWALLHNPQDSKILENIAVNLLQKTIDAEERGRVYTTLDGKKIIDVADWRTWYLGFFYDYKLIRSNDELNENEKLDRINQLVKNWENYLSQHQVD